MHLRTRDVSWGVDGLRIVRGVSLEVRPGELVGLIGPNGSGKSSLLRCVYRVLRPEAGLVTLDEEDVWRMSAREVARRAAVVVQESPTDFDFTAREMASMGRSPHKGLLDRDTREDSRIVDEALERVGALRFADRSFGSLSGGEKQRVLLARALAQRARFLILDEPTNHLDVRYQLEILGLVRNLGKTLGVGALAALHDLNLAALYCDRLYALADGRVRAGGSPEAVLSEGFVRDLYGVECEVRLHPTTGRPDVTFLPDLSATRATPEADRIGG
jgi:iron complex transport system ATP-binding protein